MKPGFGLLRLCLQLVACFCLTMWLAGCTTYRVDWAARVGHYSYDQAVTEMGPPDKHSKLEDGSVVAEWLQYRGTTYIYGTPGPYWRGYGGYATAYTTPSQFLRLTFGPGGQLAAWKKTYR